LSDVTEALAGDVRYAQTRWDDFLARKVSRTAVILHEALPDGWICYFPGLVVMHGRIENCIETRQIVGSSPRSCNERPGNAILE
jgi:hypothetical protein